MFIVDYYPKSERIAEYLKLLLTESNVIYEGNVVNISIVTLAPSLS